MYILTIYGKETEGAYSVADDEGDQILYLFEEEDDAMRYATVSYTHLTLPTILLV